MRTTNHKCNNPHTSTWKSFLLFLGVCGGAENDGNPQYLDTGTSLHRRVCCWNTFFFVCTHYIHEATLWGEPYCLITVQSSTTALRCSVRLYARTAIIFTPVSEDRETWTERKETRLCHESGDFLFQNVLLTVHLWLREATKNAEVTPVSVMAPKYHSCFQK